jgi:hypothetical protein
MQPTAGQRSRERRVAGRGDDRGGWSAGAGHRLGDQGSEGCRPQPRSFRPRRPFARRLAGPRSEGTQGPQPIGVTTLESTPLGRALEGSRRVWIRLRAADRQQFVSNDPTRSLTSHHGASSLNLSEQDRCSAARGGGEPRESVRMAWHARGQGFKSPQLHQAQRHFHSRSERHLPEIARKRGPWPLEHSLC